VAERAVLVLAGLRARARSRAAAFGAAAGAAALALAVLSSAGSAGGAAPVATDAVLLAVGVLAALAVAGGATDLPAARAAGTEEWLAAAAPSGAERRLARAGAAALATLATGLLATLVALALLAATGRLVPTRAVTPLALPEDSVRLAADRPRADLDLALPAGGAARALELDLRPVWRDVDAAAAGRCALRVAFDGGEPTCPEGVPERGTFRLPLPAGAARVRVGAAEPAVDVVVLGARVVGAPRSAAGNVLLAGLLATLGVACAAPLAVLLSRGVSGAAAAAATALLVLVGVAHGPLLSLAADVEVRHAWPAAVLRTAARLAPDLSGLAAVSDAARGRAIPAGAFLALAPALAHAGVCLLALLPGRGRTS
jgi:hypothetical protein